MILLAHLLLGAVVGYKIENVFLAIVIAFLCHYFLDLFPHVEYFESVESSIEKIRSDSWQKNVLNILKVILDFCLGILIIFIFSKNQPIIYICAVIATIPDAITVITSFWPNKLLLAHQKIHAEKIHFLKYKKISNFWRVSTQVATVIICIILLEYRTNIITLH